MISRYHNYLIGLFWLLLIPLVSAKAAERVLENAGLQHASKSVNGIFLTIDLCPTQKPLNRDLFLSLKNLSSQRPLPIAISVAGLWLEQHETDLRWLITFAKENRFEMTWVNHAYSHHYFPGKPLAHNFLLSPGVHLKDEISKTNSLMRANHLTPSPFFRFPGLVANDQLMFELKQARLIPLGADAWLAKNQRVHPGSIILVHGNGNERIGIEKLKQWLKTNKQPFLPLEKAI